MDSAANVVNKGWKMNARGNLDWSMSGDDFNESLMDMASSGVNTFINSGLNGYGKGPSLGSYLLTKGVDMAKYGMMQNGWLGQGLKNKYAGQSTFDLAGGMDISFDFGKAGDDMQNPLATASFGLHFGNGGMQLHDGPGEISANTVWSGIEQVGSAIGTAAVGIGSAVGSLWDNVFGEHDQLPVPDPYTGAAGSPQYAALNDEQKKIILELNKINPNLSEADLMKFMQEFKGEGSAYDQSQIEQYDEKGYQVQDGANYPYVIAKKGYIGSDGEYYQSYGYDIHSGDLAAKEEWERNGWLDQDSVISPTSVNTGKSDYATGYLGIALGTGLAIPALSIMGAAGILTEVGSIASSVFGIGRVAGTLGGTGVAAITAGQAAFKFGLAVNNTINAVNGGLAAHDTVANWNNNGQSGVENFGDVLAGVKDFTGNQAVNSILYGDVKGAGGWSLASAIIGGFQTASYGADAIINNNDSGKVWWALGETGVDALIAKGLNKYYKSAAQSQQATFKTVSVKNNVKIAVDKPGIIFDPKLQYMNYGKNTWVPKAYIQQKSLLMDNWVKYNKEAFKPQYFTGILINSAHTVINNAQSKK